MKQNNSTKYLNNTKKQIINPILQSNLFKYSHNHHSMSFLKKQEVYAFKILSHVIIYMNCTIELHDELSQNYINCPFCEHQTSDYYTDKQSDCFEQPDIIEDNSRLLCINCGQIGNELFKTNYIDFYENMYKIRKKSVYIRKYHVQNVLSDIEHKNKLQISRAITNRVCKRFDQINTVLSQLNKDRKRIISIKFIISKLFRKI